MSDLPVTVRQAAQQIGISLHQLDTWIKRANITLFPDPVRSLPESTVDQMEKEFRKQVSKEKIADVLHLPGAWIYRWLRQHGVRKFPYFHQAYFDRQEVDSVFKAKGFSLPPDWIQSGCKFDPQVIETLHERLSFTPSCHERLSFTPSNKDEETPPEDLEGISCLEAADRLQCRRNVIFTYLKRGRLRGTKAHGRWWIEEVSVDELRNRLEMTRKKAVEKRQRKANRQATLKKIAETHLTRREVASTLGITHQAVTSLIKNGKLRVIWIANQSYIAKCDLAVYLKESTVPDGYLPLAKVAEKLGIRQGQMYKLIYRGAIVAKKIKEKWYIKEKDLKEITDLF